MKTLILMRHAKSDWGDADLADFDRPLNARGRKAAPLMAERLAAGKWQPDLAFYSPARRTTETLDLMKPHLPATIKLTARKALYLAMPRAILGEIAKAPDSAATILILGHNPGLADLARWLTGKGKTAEIDRLRGKFPTGGIAILAFDANSWSQIGEAEGRLEKFLAPRDAD